MLAIIMARSSLILQKCGGKKEMERRKGETRRIRKLKSTFAHFFGKSVLMAYLSRDESIRQLLSQLYESEIAEIVSQARDWKEVSVEVGGGEREGEDNSFYTSFYTSFKHSFDSNGSQIIYIHIIYTQTH